MRRPSTTSSALFVFLALGTAGFLLPQIVSGEDASVDFEATFTPSEARVGESVVLSIEAAIPKGYHFYSMKKIEGGPLPLQVIFDEDVLEPLTDWKAPAPRVEMDPNFNKEVEFFVGKVTHKRGFKVLRKAEGNELPLKMKAQICDDKQCIPLFPKVSAALTVLDGEARPDRTAVPEIVVAEASQGHGDDLLGEGLLWFILAAIGFGFLALATPCVFPMIPITISFFSKFSEVSTRRSVAMATIYTVSIIAVFTLLGLVLTAIFGGDAMQDVSTHPVFNVFMVALLVVFAFNLFGLFEIRMPNWLISRSAQKEQELTSGEGSFGRQAAGVFFMAVTFTLVSFTCTVGFLGMVLALATQGEWFYAIVGMVGFAFGFALPFFFLALFPKLAGKLQGKGGDWMVAVKVTLGFLEAAFAFKFISNLDLHYEWGLITRPTVLAIWGVLSTLAGLYLLRVFALPHNDTETRHIGPIRMIIALVFLVFAVHLFAGVNNTRPVGGWIDGWLPPAVYPGQEAISDEGGGSAHLSWIKDDMDKGFEIARAENRPLFIDFTGFQCTNCRQMEASIFPVSRVKGRLEKMVRVQAYTDGPKPVHDKQRQYQMKRFETAALPFYAIIDPHTDKVLASFSSMTNSVEEYVRFLDKGLDAFEKVKPKDSSADQKEARVGGGEAGHGEPAAADAGPAREKEGVPFAESGEKVDFEFPMLKGDGKFKLSSLRGQWVFVNFWASWCAPCKKELKNDFPTALASAPHVKLVTIAFEDEDTRESAVEFAGEAGLWKHTALMGPDDVEEAGFAEVFGASNALPISYLIHPDGHIAWKKKGSIHKELLVDLLSKTKPASSD